MNNHAIEEVKLLVPFILGVLMTAGMTYGLEAYFHPKIYSLPLIGFGLSLLLSSWFGRKVLFLALGIALSTPIWVVATNWTALFS